jgi:hypothetical protein
LTGQEFYAQDVEEFTILKDQVFQAFVSNLNGGSSISVHPDPEIGSATISNDTINNNLNLTFTPHEGVTGTVEIYVEYLVFGPPLHPVTRIFIIHVVDVIARPDYFSVAFNSVENILPVITNDTTTTDSLVLTEIALVNNGEAQLVNNEISFTPDEDFEGMAYVTYVACNDLAVCDKAVVSILVRNSSADTDTIRLRTAEDEPVVAILPSAGFEVNAEPSNGELYQVAGFNAWEYKPESGFSGEDSFVFTKDSSAIRVVLVDVTEKSALNTFAVDDIVYTRINQAVDFDVLANDVKEYSITFTQPNTGILVHDTLGQFTFIPPLDFKGIVDFSYNSCVNFYCEEAQVTIYVDDMVPENTKTYRLSTGLNTPLVINYDIPLEDFEFYIEGAPDFGNLAASWIFGS